MSKTIKVVEVLLSGKKRYLINPSIFHPQSTTENPLNATNYLGEPAHLERDLHVLVLPDDTFMAKSGLRVDSVPLVKEYVIYVTEVSSYVGREAR